MKKPQIFNIDVELIDFLKEQGNMSLIVNDLIREHAQKVKPLKAQYIEAKKKEEEAKVEAEKILKINTERKQLVQEYKEETPVVQESTLRQTQRACFNRWEIEDKDIEPLFEQFWEDYQAKKYSNILEFMEEKGINKKQPRHNVSE
jgi:hypothetical protein